MRSGEEIRAALVPFVRRWKDFSGSEKAEAQTFLNELFTCYGSDRQSVGARFEDFRASAGFMDLHWPETLIVEMKRPGVAIASAREQVHRYWQESADDDADRQAARYVLLCNFREFEIWEPGRFPRRPRLAFPIDELPEKYDALMFLADTAQEPVFSEHHRTLTRDAAVTMARLFTSLSDRLAAPADEIQRFILQSVWCLFAEDLGMLDGYPMESTINQLIRDPHRSPSGEFGNLFRVLGQKGKHNRTGILAGTRYVNGALFENPAYVDVDRDELMLLREAATFGWAAVDPTIFGSLLEGVLGEERRGELGAHYTHEADIMKIVGPTIVRPWRERIEAVSTPAEALGVLRELCAFTVLDPACGCGNFLYVAYRELRSLEHELKDLIRRTAEDTGLPVPAGPWPFYPLTNLHGIDIEPIAVSIARLTLWMGQRQMIDRYGPAENPLPLTTLSGIRRQDALFSPWPEVDAIIGNPPFLGSQLLRQALGGDYLERLEKEFGVGIKDLCVYWYRRTNQQLKPGQRAGLVGTNSVSQNRARAASLDYVVTNGGVITDAISSQKWPGEAKVHVSIVNWIKEPTTPITGFRLDGETVTGIGSSLRSDTGTTWEPRSLAANKGRCFQGPIPVGDGFIVGHDEARALLADESADYAAVVRPYLVGEDIADDPAQRPSRWIIDFGTRPLEVAMRFPRALDIVRTRVKPKRDENSRKVRREKWWQFGENAVGMRSAIQSLDRYVAIMAQGKRYLATWVDAGVCPSNLTNVVAADDDDTMGVLLSQAHEAWAWHKSSTLKADLRYTPTSVFATFPFPHPVADADRQAIAAAARELIDHRTELCRREQLGLTALYNLMDDGAFSELRSKHRILDEAVVHGYGWPRSTAQDRSALVARLTELNRQIVELGREYAPFAAAGSDDSRATGPSEMMGS